MSGNSGRKPARTSISAHPAFPGIVALWFAALLGFGSLVLPVALFERASEASGLASTFAAAQAPLGVTARFAIALAAAGIGVLAGLAIAARVTAANAPSREKSAKRPIFAHEEFGFDGIDAEDHEGAPSPEQALAVYPEETIEEVAASDAPEWTAPFEESGTGAEDEPVDDEVTPHFEERETREPDMVRAEEHQAAPDPADQSIVVLVERFARALQRHRDAEQEHAASRDAVVDLSAALAAKAPSAPPLAEPLFAADRIGLSEMPAAPRLFGHDDLDAGEEDGHDAEQDRGENYPSLLAMKRPPREAPQPHAGDTERALRDALERLQRLSGAA